MKKILKGIAFSLVLVVSFAFFVGCTDKNDKNKDDNAVVPPTPDTSNATTEAEYLAAAKQSSKTMMSLFGSIFNFNSDEYSQNDLTSINTWIYNYARPSSVSTSEDGIKDNTFLYQDKGDNQGPYESQDGFVNRYNYAQYLRLASIFMYSFSEGSELNPGYIENVKDLYSIDLTSKKPIEFGTVYRDTYAKNTFAAYARTGLGDNIYSYADFYVQASKDNNKIYFNFIENSNDYLQDSVQITIDYDFVKKQINSIDVFVLTFYSSSLRNSEIFPNDMTKKFGIENFSFDLKNSKFNFKSFALEFSSEKDSGLKTQRHSLSRITSDYNDILDKTMYLNNILPMLKASKTRLLQLNGEIDKDGDFYNLKVEDYSKFTPSQISMLSEGSLDAETAAQMRAKISQVLLSVNYVNSNKLFVADRSSLNNKRINNQIIREALYYHIEQANARTIFVEPSEIDNSTTYKYAVQQTIEQSRKMISEFANQNSLRFVDELSDQLGKDKYSRVLSIMEYAFIDSNKMDGMVTEFINQKYALNIEEKNSITLDKLYKEILPGTNDYYTVETDSPYNNSNEFYYIAELQNNKIIFRLIEISELGFQNLTNITINFNFRTNTPTSLNIASFTNYTITDHVNKFDNTIVEDLTLKFINNEIEVFSFVAYGEAPKIVEALELGDYRSLKDRIINFAGSDNMVKHSVHKITTDNDKYIFTKTLDFSQKYFVYADEQLNNESIINEELKKLVIEKVLAFLTFINPEDTIDGSYIWGGLNYNEGLQTVK